MILRLIYKISFIILISFLSSSCVVGPDYKRPKFPIPKDYQGIIHPNPTESTNVRFGESQRFEVGQDICNQWWEVFHSKKLNELILTAFRHNPDVGVAKANLRTALEAAYAQRGEFVPYVGLSWAPTIQQTSGVLQSNLASNAYVYSLYTGQLFLSYNPNVFGNLTRAQESLMWQVEKAKFELEAAYLTISTNVVTAVIQAATLRAQYSYIKRLVKAQSEIVHIYRSRYQMGDIAKSDLLLQESELAQTMAELPILKKQIQLQRNLVNSLVGRYPADRCTPRFHFKDFKLPQDLPLTIPSVLLEHRPDVRAAEADMKAANALIGVAIANRIPMVTIGATNLGTAATQLGDFFARNSNFWALAGFVAQPIFAGGRLRHEQLKAEAIYKQAQAQYKSTVIGAFKDVADVVRSIQQDARAVNIARLAERRAYESLKISRLQLKLGDGNAVLILANLLLYQRAKIDLIVEQGRRLSDTAALFQVLGGGWWNKSEYKTACYQKTKTRFPGISPDVCFTR